MKFGAPFWGAFSFTDPLEIRDYVQAVEELGYDHLFMDEVLLNDNPEEIFHESMTLFAYLAGFTTRLKLVTGVMILPKRTTLVVARQAAEVDFLSGGRLRLGVGVGWNKPEYRALGVDFHTRGKRIEEQINLLHLLWTEPEVHFKGTYHDHQVEGVGLNLLPVQRPIPVWIGGGADVVLRRAARIGDGWIAYLAPAEEFRMVLSCLRTYLAEYGRQADPFPIVNYLPLDKIPRAKWGKSLEEWRGLGVTHTVVLPPVSWTPGAIRYRQALEALQTFRREICS